MRCVAARLTQRDSCAHHRSHQRPCGRSVDPGGVSDEAGAALQDAAVDADIVNPHEAASREGEAPVSL